MAAPIKLPSANARILIATDNQSEGDQLLQLLKVHFESVALSTSAERAGEEFAEHRPDVLVLGFESLELAQRYYLGVHRFAPGHQLHPHRTVLLCDKAEVLAAFELCKTQYFDDYVLYWPQAYDGLRLPMSVWLACREIAALRAVVPQPSELRAHAGQMATLEQTLKQEITTGEERLAIAGQSLTRLEQEIAGSDDALARRLIQRGTKGLEGAQFRKALSEEMKRLKAEHQAQASKAREEGLEPATEWAAQLKDRVEPALQGARTLAESVKQVRRSLLAIDDDEMSRVLLSRALSEEPYDILFAVDGPEAIQRLKFLRPDIILMDVRMPGIDGIALTRLLKKSASLAAIPIVMMTGDARRETVASSIGAGAAAFVVKPFTRESLIKKLEEVLAR